MVITELIEAYVLENTPSLLSLGKRCMEHGYRFTWDPYQIPRLFDPTGREIKLELINKYSVLVAYRDSDCVCKHWSP